MALILPGSRCALCEQVLEAADEVLATTAFIEDRDHPFWKYSDAAMHQRCFMAWPEREGFIACFNAYWDTGYRGIRHMCADGTIEDREPRPGGTVQQPDAAARLRRGEASGGVIEPMQIREASLDDRDAILGLDDVARVDPARVHFIERVLREATCLVAEQSSRIVAYGVLEYTFFENGFISLLYVAEPERRRGFGRAVFEGLRARCTTRKLFTSTNHSNEPMHAWLGSVGFRPSGVIDNLDPGDPEVVYFLDLGERPA